MDSGIVRGITVMTTAAPTGTIEPTEKTETACATNADGLLTDSLDGTKEQLMPNDGIPSTHPQSPTTIEIEAITGFTFKNPLRAMVHARAGGLCWYCGAPALPWNFHIDHFVPLVYGGTNDWSNLVPACPHCNMSKGSKTIEEFRWAIQQKRAGMPRFSDEQSYWLHLQGFVFPELPDHRFHFEVEGLEL